MADWHITAMTSEHDRGQLACGQPSLDRFLRESAKQNQDKDVSRTFVLIQKGNARIYGYFTLAAGQIERTSLPPSVSKKLPKYPVPVVILARLAVDDSLKGQKLGRMLLWDALNRCVAVSESFGLFAVVVDAIDEPAAEFYKHFGFTSLEGSPLKLHLPISTIRKALRP